MNTILDALTQQHYETALQPVNEFCSQTDIEWELTYGRYERIIRAAHVEAERLISANKPDWYTSPWDAALSSYPKVRAIADNWDVTGEHFPINVIRVLLEHFTQNYAEAHTIGNE